MVRIVTLVATLLGMIAVVDAQAPTGQAPTDRPSAQQAAEPQQSAPQPAQQQSAQQNQQQRSGQAADKVTLSGCLRPGASPGSWILENEEVASAAPTGAAQAQPGEAVRGTTGTPAAKKTYSLIAKAGDDLKPHANHKIEVTGTISQAPRAAAAAATAKPAADASPQQNFNIESFKMVSASCQ